MTTSPHPRDAAPFGTGKKFLMEFATNSVFDAGTPQRYRVTQLGKPDLPEYLDIHDIAPDVPACCDWQLLRQHLADQVGKTCKPAL